MDGLVGSVGVRMIARAGTGSGPNSVAEDAFIRGGVRIRVRVESGLQVCWLRFGGRVVVGRLLAPVLFGVWVMLEGRSRFAGPRMVRCEGGEAAAELGIDALDLGFEVSLLGGLGQRRVWPAWSASWSQFQDGAASERCGLLRSSRAVLWRLFARFFRDRICLG